MVIYPDFSVDFPIKMLLQQTSPHSRSYELSTLNENSTAVGLRYGSAETKSVRSETLAPSDPFDLFPASLQGELCWDSSSFYDAKHKYIMQLDQTDILAIDQAIASFKGTSSISRTIFKAYD